MNEFIYYLKVFSNKLIFEYIILFFSNILFLNVIIYFFNIFLKDLYFKFKSKKY